MIRVVFVFLVGSLIMAAVIGAFHYWVGSDLPISIWGNDWATFGDYFGGVAGTLLSFVSILLIVYTIHQQSVQTASMEEEALKRDLLQYISKADEEVERWLRKRLATKTEGQLIEFGDVVWGLVKPGYINAGEFNPALERLLKLTCTYCASLGLYRENINSYFIFQQHRQKAEDLVVFLEEHLDNLPSIAGPSITACRSHLHG